MITAAERANKLSGMQATTMNADDLMAFIEKALCYGFDTKRVSTVK
jgi:hypothetical protein